MLCMALRQAQQAELEKDAGGALNKDERSLNTIGVLFGCFAGKIDGDCWFTW